MVTRRAGQQQDGRRGTKARSVVWRDGERKVELTGLSKKDQPALVELLADERDE